MGGVVQTFGTDTIHICLKCSKIASKAGSQLDIFLCCLSVVRFLRREIERERENLGLERLIAKRSRSELNIKKKKQVLTHPQSIIALNVMSSRISTRNITKCAVLEFEICICIRERAKACLRITVENRRVLDVV